MTKKVYLPAAVFSFAVMAMAQSPTITPNGIVNVASFAFAGLPSGDIAQGSMVTIFGTNMGPSALQQATSYPLPSSLGGTSLKVTSGTTTVTPIINYTSATQIAAIIPSNTPVGPATMTVTYNGQTSAPVQFKVVANSFGVFTTNQGGTGPGIIADANSKVFGANSAANPGDAAVIWGTGLGPVTGNEAAGALPGDMPAVPVEVYVGTTLATVTYRGRSGCCAGVDQITFTVPNVIGCHVSVALKINNTVSNFSTMPIAPAGTRTCSDPGSPTASELQRYSVNGATVGSVALSRVSSSIDVPILGSISTSVDVGSAGFYKYTPQQLNSSQNPFSTTTAGSCTVFYSKGGATPPADPIVPAFADAGAAITVAGAGGTKQLAKSTVGGLSSYSAVFGTTTTGGSPGYLEPGTFTITGLGGSAVGAFSTTLVVPTALNWTNQSTTSTVSRANGQLVTWTGGDPNGFVLISGSSVNGSASDSVGSSFNCYAKPSDGRFTIPAVVLLNLPVSATVSGVPLGALYVGAVSAPKSFVASGLDTGVAVSTVSVLKTVNYQ